MAATVPDADGELPPDLLEQAAERLLGHTGSARAAVLDDLARAHPEHATALRRLADDLGRTEFLLDAGFDTAEEPLTPIGPYRVLQVIGEGAFGVVYRCAQETPVRREVAIKVLRPGAGDRNTLARFASERHVLATLAHPAIAQVFDAGALPDGRPYFVMEYVRGAPITAFCDQACLDVDARLGLFVRLCLGVHHAHERGIVHRDLKPANVLVYEQDGVPQPKIIDFGIAKAVHGASVPEGVHTETGRVVGTPGYMSPEQAVGARSEVDARTDVFALGVMLYELLTADLPWGRRPESTDSDPPRPSARVATDSTGDVARQRATAARKLASRLRGDLDWIVLKALARARDDRYPSAQALAADVGRHLRAEPVQAGPPALAYRVRKLLRRRRSATLATIAVLLALGLGLWASLHYAAEARSRTADVEDAARNLLARARDRAIVESPRSEELRRALASDALALYERFLRERPEDAGLREGRARALWTLSQVHWLVGAFERAEEVAEEATQECETLVASAPDRLDYRGLLGNTLRNLGRAASRAGRLDQARAAFSRAVDELERCYRGDATRFADLLVAALMEWASARTPTEMDACVQATRRAVSIQEDTVRQRPSLAARVDLLDALTALVVALTTHGDLQDAAAAFARVETVLRDPPAVGDAHECHALGAGATLAGTLGQYNAAVDRTKHTITTTTH